MVHRVVAVSVVSEWKKRMGKTYTGVDIGNYSLKMVVSDGISIKNATVETMPEGLVTDDRIVSYDAMADFIEDVAQRMGGSSKEVSVLLPKSVSFSRRLRIPAMTQKELDINLPYEFRDFIQQGKDKYFYDYAVLATQDGPDGKPESMDLLAVAAQKKTIEEYREMFKRAGMRLCIAMPYAAAWQNLVGGNPRALANCCVVDFSYEATKLHFFIGGAYDVTRVIEIGGQDIDRAIAQEYGIDAHLANSYKHSNFECVQESAAAKGVYESISVEIGRALNFYGFNNPDTPVEVAYYSGGDAQLSCLIDTVATHTDVSLRDISVIMPTGLPDPLLLQCPAAFGATITD